MSEKQEQQLKKLYLDSADRVLPIVFVDDDSGNKYKFYVQKIGYPWKTKNKEGIANRIELSYGKLDIHGDITGDKKYINIPSGLSKEDYKKLLDLILSVKDKPIK